MFNSAMWVIMGQGVSAREGDKAMLLTFCTFNCFRMHLLRICNHGTMIKIINQNIDTVILSTQLYTELYTCSNFINFSINVVVSYFPPSAGSSSGLHLFAVFLQSSLFYKKSLFVLAFMGLTFFYFFFIFITDQLFCRLSLSLVLNHSC